MKFYYRFLLLFLIVTVAHATPSADLISLLNGVSSMKANFTQTVTTTRGKVTQKSFGKMTMQRPGKFRWDVVKPIPQLIIANGNKLWIYDPDLEQLTIRGLNQAAGESPALLLSHDNSKLESSYEIQTIAKNTPDWKWFSLKPKHKGDMFEMIQLGFKQRQIQEMRLQDNLGHTTMIQFQNIQMNSAVAASSFNFQPSAKIDVIDETRKRR